MEGTGDTGSILNGKYRLDRLIGAGGMGKVYEATHLALDRKLAIKTIEAGRECGPEVVRRFGEEAKHAGALAHDHICDVFDVGTTENGRPFLVMPLLRGRSLGEEMSRCGRLPIGRAQRIAIQILSALEAAHAEGIVHRDLKPDNVFLVRVDGQDDFVKLLDFGISKILDSHGMVEVTDTGTVRGTPAYMAPEQAAGERRVDHRLDLYAVGVVLYEMLTGVRPFAGATYNEVLGGILTKPFARPRTLVSAIPPCCEEDILCAMSRHPADRFRSAAQMRAAIESWDTAMPRGCDVAETGTVSASVAPLRGTAGQRRRLDRVALPSMVIAVLAIAGIATFAALSAETAGTLSGASDDGARVQEPSHDSKVAGSVAPNGAAAMPEGRTSADAEPIAAQPVARDPSAGERPHLAPDVSDPKMSAKPRVVHGPFNTKIVTDFGD